MRLIDVLELFIGFENVSVFTFDMKELSPGNIGHYYKSEIGYMDNIDGKTIIVVNDEFRTVYLV